MVNWKEVAKFVSGLSAWEAIVHGSLWLSEITPTIFGITLTETLNMIQTIIPAIISIVLAYYAWIKK
ncbi:MAG: hypothetical protein ACE5KE_08900 [Methanosarcinales archaeon]